MENKEFVVAEDVATKDFEDWCEANGIEYDTDSMTEEEIADFNSHKKPIIKACMNGNLAFNNGEIDYTISKYSDTGFAGTVLHVGKPTGKIWSSLDGFKETQPIKKMVSVMSALTGKDLGYFDKLAAVDWKVLQGIVVFFLTI